MRALIILAVLWVPAVFAVELTELQDRLRTQQQFVAQLTQSKTLKGWNKPLQAKGLLACTPDDGVLYQLQQPLQASYWLQPTQISLRENNATVKVMTFEQMPWLAGIATLLSASVSGDWQRLQQQFAITARDRDDKQWQLDLTPLQVPLKDNLQAVQVLGTTQIDELLIRDKKGDVTVIRLQQHQNIDRAAMLALLQQAGLR